MLKTLAPPLLNKFENDASYLAVLAHEYLFYFRRGLFPSDHIRSTWLNEQACLSRSFSHCFAGLLAHMPPSLISENGRLLRCLNEESWSNNSRQAHPALFANLAKKLETDVDIHATEPQLDSTKRFIDERQTAITRSELAYALGVMLGNEFINANTDGSAGIMVAYNEGLKRLMGEEEQYTRAHVEEEVNDINLFLDIADKMTNPDSRKRIENEIIEGAGFLFRLRLMFFDGLLASV